MILRLIKWTVIGAAALCATGYVLFGTQIGSYLGTAASSFREGVAESIPIDFELKRARNLIREIDPQLHDARRELAQSEVDLQAVQEEVTRLEKEVGDGERKLRAVSASMTGGSVGFTFANNERVRVRVEFDLERTFEAFKNKVALLEGKKKLIARQEHAVSAARLRLDAVRAEKGRLEEMVAALTTQKRQLDALAASSRTIELDDTALGRAREVLDQVKNRLDVAQRMLEDEIFAAPEGKAASRDIVAEITRYFGSDGEEEAPAEGCAAEPLTVEIR
ncbi:MAG: hypothetical protein HZB39_19160 [Planctomycetes bacterium]|nr:hypothetical protein [Planctomycetota bacterium]